MIFNCYKHQLCGCQNLGSVNNWTIPPIRKIPRVAIALLFTVWSAAWPQNALAELGHFPHATTAENSESEASDAAGTGTDAHSVVAEAWDESPFSTAGTFESERWKTGALYAGAHAAYTLGSSRTQLAFPFRNASTSALGSLYGGIQVGYLLALHSPVVVGVESDLSFPNFLAGNDTVASLTTEAGSYVEQIDCVGHLRSRIGYAWDRWLWFVTGGLSWSRARFIEHLGTTDSANERARLLPGFMMGAGVEVGISRKWTARLELLHDEFVWKDAVFRSGASLSSATRMNSLRLGLQWLP